MICCISWATTEWCGVSKPQRATRFGRKGSEANTTLRRFVRTATFTALAGKEKPSCSQRAVRWKSGRRTLWMTVLWPRPPSPARRSFSGRRRVFIESRQTNELELRRGSDSPEVGWCQSRRHLGQKAHVPSWNLSGARRFRHKPTRCHHLNSRGEQFRLARDAAAEV